MYICTYICTDIHTLTFILILIKLMKNISRGSSSRRLGNDREGERSSHERDRDRDSFSRWRDRQYYGPRRWLETALKDSWEKDSGMKIHEKLGLIHKFLFEY